MGSPSSYFPSIEAKYGKPVEHWLKLLKEDDRAILTAAARAEEASSLLLKLGGREVADTVDAGSAAALAA